MDIYQKLEITTQIIRAIGISLYFVPILFTLIAVLKKKTTWYLFLAVVTAYPTVGMYFYTEETRTPLSILIFFLLLILMVAFVQMHRQSSAHPAGQISLLKNITNSIKELAKHLYTSPLVRFQLFLLIVVTIALFILRLLK